MGMDLIDRKLLELLQEDATMPIAELATRVNLSQTPCWKRVQRLKDTGVIRAQVALCDPRKLGVGTTVFVAVRTNQHTQSWADEFTRAVRDIPEVVEVYRMSGETDYLMRVVVSDSSNIRRRCPSGRRSATRSEVWAEPACMTQASCRNPSENRGA